MNLGFWLKWSWRDLRARWLQVLAIGIIIALGTGIYASMGGSEVWRTDAYDLSYGNLNMYDIHVDLVDDSYLNMNEVADALSDIDGIATMETRLISPTLVDASHGDEVIMVKGELVGLDVSDGGPHVNGVYVDAESGRSFTAADAGQNVAVVEYKFVQARDLELGSPIRISGGHDLDFVGAGHSPEYFMIQGDIGDFFGQENFAVLFVSLETAQRLTGNEGMVNDVVILLEDDADRDAVRETVESRMAAAFPDLGVTTGFTEDDAIYTLLYTDAEGDQAIWNMISMLFLAGAAMGAFNLAGRMVESQRREIGIGMALGVNRKWLAFRPLLVGFQIALLGTIFGVIFGLLMLDGFASLVKGFAPLPFWDIKLYPPSLIIAIALGIAMPLIATIVPVWRAVRVEPIDAIKSGYLVAKGDGPTPLGEWLSRATLAGKVWAFVALPLWLIGWLVSHLLMAMRRMPLPGRSFSQMPVKNVLRSPWRTSLTICGVAIAILLMVVLVGAMDTYEATMAQADDAYRYMADDRYTVILSAPFPKDNGEISAIRSMEHNGSPMFTELETSLMLDGSIWSETNTEPVEIILEFHDMDEAIWVPNLLEGELASSESGVIISEKAAEDLDVWVGDTITMKHRVLFALRETEVTVVGIHDNPFRPFVYMDMEYAAMTGFAQSTNYLVLNVAEGVTEDDVKLAMLNQPGVASVKPIIEFSRSVETLLEMMTGMLAIAQIVAIFLAFLIAFLSTSISVDERVREIATMFAFGLRIRTVTRMQMIENFIIGLFGTTLGIVLGWLTMQSIFVTAEEQTPEIGFSIVVAPETILLALVLGVMVVTLTPLLSIRRMRNMDIPSTLRVME
jgi:putative ABC transport system permease protein